MSVHPVDAVIQSATKIAHSIDYDQILEHIGHLGTFQLKHVALLCLPAMFPGIVVMSYTFTGAIPRYRCLIEECEDVNNYEFEPFWLNNTMPWDDHQAGVSCQRYGIVRQCTRPPVDGRLMSCQEHFFDKSLFRSTVVTDFDLTCDNEWKQTLTSTVYMSGMLFGAMACGSVADLQPKGWIGRKWTYSLICLFLGLSSTASAFSPDFVSFAALRFGCGFGAAGFFLVLFVWGVEAVGQKYRVMCGFVYQTMFSLGSALLGLIAYFVRDWRTLQLVISVPIFTCLLLHRLLPESTRWLISKSRFDQAEQMILKASQVNGKPVPKQLISTPADGSSQQDGSSESFCVVVHLLWRRILLIFLAWIAAVMGYYGITYSATNLDGHFHLNYELTVLVELPSYAIGILFMEKLGRRPTLSGGLVISGISCLVTGLIPQDYWKCRVAFSLVGKGFSAIVLATVFSYTAELFPTSARSSVVGMASTVGRIGGISAPFIASQGRTLNQSVPYIIFAGVNLAVGLLCLLLPETNGVPLPATVRQAAAIRRPHRQPLPAAQ